MNNIELCAEERMLLHDLVGSDAWKVVKKISDFQYRKCLESLVSVSEAGDFRHIQGVAHGWRYLIDSIERSSHPEEWTFDSGVSESALNARKAT